MNCMNDLMQWIEDWIYSEQKHNFVNPNISMMTIDNPGWAVTADLLSNLIGKKVPLADVMKNDDDWYYCTIKDNQFFGDGALFNLEDIFGTLRQLVTVENSQIASCSQGIKVDDDLSWLLQWFAKQCDGDWEHANGIRIGTTDTPGWCLKISIAGTELENKKFQNIDNNREEHDWIFC